MVLADHPQRKGTLFLGILRFHVCQGACTLPQEATITVIIRRAVGLPMRSALGWANVITDEWDLVAGCLAP